MWLLKSTLCAFEFIHSQLYPKKMNLGIWQLSDQNWQKAGDIFSPWSLILFWFQAKAKSRRIKLSFMTDLQEATERKMCSTGPLVSALATFQSACSSSGSLCKRELCKIKNKRMWLSPLSSLPLSAWESPVSWQQIFHWATFVTCNRVLILHVKFWSFSFLLHKIHGVAVRFKWDSVCEAP